MRAALIFGLAAATLSAGCSVFAPVRIDTTSYVLDKVPAGSNATAAAGSPVLSVPMPEAAPLYATRQMAYSTEPHQIGHFNESEWALPPAQMVHPLLVETLRATGRFTVVDPAAPIRGGFALRTEVLEVLQDFTVEPALFRLRMRVSLERGTDHGLVGARELSATEPLRENTARAGVAAGNQAIEKLLRDIAAFAVEKTPLPAR
jgi:cholesterol transport system auxiliary component